MSTVLLCALVLLVLSPYCFSWVGASDPVIRADFYDGNSCGGAVVASASESNCGESNGFYNSDCLVFATPYGNSLTMQCSLFQTQIAIFTDSACQELAVYVQSPVAEHQTCLLLNATAPAHALNSAYIWCSGSITRGTAGGTASAKSAGVSVRVSAVTLVFLSLALALRYVTM